MSWTLKEKVTFDETGIASIDWETYPILDFTGDTAGEDGADGAFGSAIVRCR